jgi:MraZ protein
MRGCVALFPKADWDALAERTAALGVGDLNAGRWRFLFGAAFGRARPPGSLRPASVLRDFAGLESEVVVIGARNRLELWSPQRWGQYSAQMDQPEVLAEHLQGLGI